VASPIRGPPVGLRRGPVVVGGRRSLWCQLIEDGSGMQCAAEFAVTEVTGQGASQPHRRLQLRRGPGPLGRAEDPAQEKFRRRLLLPGSTPRGGKAGFYAMPTPISPATIKQRKCFSSSSSGTT
jgi:hypothetical protein